jgi:hypothetical protein
MRPLFQTRSKALLSSAKVILVYLIFNRLLYNFQSGFIPGYSTTHQLVELYHNILLALDNKEMTSITFADDICSRMKGEILVYNLTAKTCRPF